MNIINVTVRGKIARAEGRARVVCGNSDYAVRFDFDAEWAEYAVKTARFVSEDGSYTDVQFEGSDCAVPILRNTRTLLVGVFAGNLRTTTAALIHAVPCITDPDGTPADPTPDVYAQLMERFNKMEAPAAILYEKQDLTAEQQATARENIGAMDQYRGLTPVTGTDLLGRQITLYVEMGYLKPLPDDAAAEVASAYKYVMMFGSGLAGIPTPQSLGEKGNILNYFLALHDAGLLADYDIIYSDLDKTVEWIFEYVKRTGEVALTACAAQRYTQQSRAVKKLSDGTYTYSGYDLLRPKYASDGKTLQLPQTEMQAEPTADAQIATKGYVDKVSEKDWEQNDETASDYIKNKPFYERGTRIVWDGKRSEDDIFWNNSGYTYMEVHWVSPETPPMSGRFKWRNPNGDTEPEWIDINSSILEWEAAQTTDYGWVKKSGGYAAVLVVTTPTERFPRVGTYLGGIRSNTSTAFYNYMYCSEFESDYAVQKIDPKFLPPSRFVVIVTEDDDGNFTADKTIAEIKAAYDAGKNVVASFEIDGPELSLTGFISNESHTVAWFDLSQPGMSSAGLYINGSGVFVTDELFIPKINPVNATNQMNNPVGVDDDGRLFSENPSVYVSGGSDKKLNIFTHLQAGKTVRCDIPELGGAATLLPYSRIFSGTGYIQYHGIAIVHTSCEELPIRFYRYTSENGIDGAKLLMYPFNNEIIGSNNSGKAVRFCGESISDTTLTEAKSIYLAQRPYLTFNGEPFIAAELTDSSITIVYIGKGEDGQYGIQQDTFDVTWKSESET